MLYARLAWQNLLIRDMVNFFDKLIFFKEFNSIVFYLLFLQGEVEMQTEITIIILTILVVMAIALSMASKEIESKNHNL